MKIIANILAGQRGAPAKVDKVQAILRSRRVHHACFWTAHRGHAGELARRFVEEEVREIVVVGGDGTISEVVNGVVGSKTNLGIIAAGTGNDLARTLRLPRKDVGAAVDIILAGRTKQVDVGCEDGRYFASVLGLGFPSEVAKKVNKTGYVRGSFAFFLAVYKTIASLRAVPLEIRLDGRVFEQECSSVLIQNTPYCGGGLLMAPSARMDDGLLDVVLVGKIKKSDLMVSFPKVYWGKHVRHPKFNFYQTNAIQVTGPGNLEKMYDGEIYGAAPINAKVVKGALNVFVPDDRAA